MIVKPVAVQVHIFGLLVLLTAVVFFSCGEKRIPAGQMNAAAADKAQAAGDYAGAFELYQGILLWQSEEEVSRELKFKASLESVKCEIEMGRFIKAVKHFKGLYVLFAEEMREPKAYKHAAVVSSLLYNRDAGIPLTAQLVHFASERHKDQKSNFEELIETMKKNAKSNEDIEALRKIGYF